MLGRIFLSSRILDSGTTVQNFSDFDAFFNFVVVTLSPPPRQLRHQKAAVVGLPVLDFLALLGPMNKRTQID